MKSSVLILFLIAALCVLGGTISPPAGGGGDTSALEERIEDVEAYTNEVGTVAGSITTLSNHVDGAFAKLDGSSFITTNKCTASGFDDPYNGTYYFAGMDEGQADPYYPPHPTYTNILGAIIKCNYEGEYWDGGGAPGPGITDYPWQADWSENFPGASVVQGGKVDADEQENWILGLGLSDEYLRASSVVAPCVFEYGTGGFAISNGPTAFEFLKAPKSSATNEIAVFSFPSTAEYATEISASCYMETNGLPPFSGVWLDFGMFYISASGTLASNSTELVIRSTNEANGGAFIITHELSDAEKAATIKKVYIKKRGDINPLVMTNHVPFWVYGVDAIKPSGE